MKYLHLITFDIPYPANYGGVIVVYYHLRALAKAGVQVILHAFQYGDRKPHSHLESLCAEVHYYPRSRHFRHQLSALPFIVQTRNSKQLLNRLLADDYPIFFEGHHSCFYIGHPKLANRHKIVRFHNIEWQYYSNLAVLEPNLVKKAYFKIECIKLYKFDAQVLRHANQIITLSKDDYLFYHQKTKKCAYISPFHPENKVFSRVGLGTYILFHGNLSVKDNERAALFLVEKIAPKVDFPIVVAGLSPSTTLQKVVAQQRNVRLYANVSEVRMNELIEEAHIHFLWTYQKAGMKLKLLKAVFRGRHCLTNSLMAGNTGLESLCHIADDETMILQHINRLILMPFTKTALQHRKMILEKIFSNQSNIQQTIELIWK